MPSDEEPNHRSYVFTGRNTLERCCAAAEFTEALKIDPTLQAAADALGSKVLKY